MKHLKRATAMFLSALLSASLLAGCGADPAANSTGTEAQGTAGAGDAGQKQITLCLSTRDEWLSTLAQAAIDAGSELGYTVNVQDCQNDTNKQLQYVETTRNAGDDVMIVNLVDYSLAQEVINAAGDMKIVFVNRMPTDEALLDESHVYVGSDESESGTYQGEFLAKHFKDQGKTDINYILLSGDLGMPSTIKRTEYALKALKDGGINATPATADLVCKWDRATTIDRLSPVLAQGTQFDCIIANNDAMALGAVEALLATNADPGSVPIVGIDATQDGRNAVKSGHMAMTVFQNADGQGAGSVKAAVNMLEGKPINEGCEFALAPNNEHVMYIPFEPVTAENVENYD